MDIVEFIMLSVGFFTMGFLLICTLKDIDLLAKGLSQAIDMLKEIEKEKEG